MPTPTKTTKQNDGAVPVEIVLTAETGMDKSVLLSLKTPELQSLMKHNGYGHSGSHYESGKRYDRYARHGGHVVYAVYACS